MKLSTVARLIEFNKVFYDTVAEDFNDSRKYEWEGWDLAWGSVELARKGKTVGTVLDVGCGNGRFLKFLKRKSFRGLYTGVDYNKRLLDIAEKIPTQFEKSFYNYDLFGLIDPELSLPGFLSENYYDLIVISGIMHHIPGISNRVRLINELSGQLSSYGCLVVTYWQFMKSPRLRKKVLEIKNSVVADLERELEEDDYIMTWERGQSAYRYCHNFSDAEIEIINSKVTTKAIRQFSSDSSLNNYVVYSNR